MRPHISMIISLIFIFNLLASQTYGFTIEKKNSLARGSIFNRMGFEDVLWKAGNNRKLLMKSTSPIVSTKEKIRKEEASTKKDSTKPDDELDIAGMDYSPAKRKPPIHN
ncbi:uncharacterized protein LOC144546416 [Carex rostrata]